MSSASQIQGPEGSGHLPPDAVCVVGAGPAGITLSLALSGAGHTVILLESGSAEVAARDHDLNDGDVEGTPYAGLRRTRGRGFGGTANIWDVELGSNPGAKYAPLDASDLKPWPFDWDELLPYYHEAQGVCGLGRFAYDAADWAHEGYRPFDLDGTGLTSGVYQFGTAAQFTKHLRGELVARKNVRILTSATVVRLLFDPSGRRVLGVGVADALGKVVEVRARRVVLACGAVENARLLLLAGDRLRSAWLGRGFMEHARDFSLVLVPAASEVFARATFYDQHAAPDGTLVGGRLSLRDDALAQFDIPNAALTLIPREATDSRISPLRRVIRRIGRSSSRTVHPPRYGWSRQPDRQLAEIGVVLNLEHRPDPRNRVTLGSRTDRFGYALPHLALQWSDEEQERLARLRQLLHDWFRGAGLGTLHTQPGRRPDLSAHHHAGTTRMAERPQDGVVDSHGAVFGVDNLYVAGASVLPTAGFVNPTLTIVAMALRLARHLGES